MLYTDGIVEAANNKFEFFGDDKLKESLLNNTNNTSKEIAEKDRKSTRLNSSHRL